MIGSAEGRRNRSPGFRYERWMRSAFRIIYTRPPNATGNVSKMTECAPSRVLFCTHGRSCPSVSGMRDRLPRGGGILSTVPLAEVDDRGAATGADRPSYATEWAQSRVQPDPVGRSRRAAVSRHDGLRPASSSLAGPPGRGRHAKIELQHGQKYHPGLRSSGACVESQRGQRGSSLIGVPHGGP
jgi:hypothetical protein